MYKKYLFKKYQLHPKKTPPPLKYCIGQTLKETRNSYFYVTKNCSLMFATQK